MARYRWAWAAVATIVGVAAGADPAPDITLPPELPAKNRVTIPPDDTPDPAPDVILPVDAHRTPQTTAGAARLSAALLTGLAAIRDAARDSTGHATGDTARNHALDSAHRSDRGSTRSVAGSRHPRTRDL